MKRSKNKQRRGRGWPIFLKKLSRPLFRWFSIFVLYHNVMTNTAAIKMMKNREYRSRVYSGFEPRAPERKRRRIHWTMGACPIQRLCKGSITLWIASFLTGLNSDALLVMSQQQIYLFKLIKTSQRGGYQVTVILPPTKLESIFCPII